MSGELLVVEAPGAFRSDLYPDFRTLSDISNAKDKL